MTQAIRYAGIETMDDMLNDLEGSGQSEAIALFDLLESVLVSAEEGSDPEMKTPKHLITVLQEVKELADYVIVWLKTLPQNKPVPREVY